MNFSNLEHLQKNLCPKVEFTVPHGLLAMMDGINEKGPLEQVQRDSLLGITGAMNYFNKGSEGYPRHPTLEPV